MNFDSYSEIFKVLSDSNRLKILAIITSENEICANDILKHFKISQPTLAYHMKLLCEVNLISVRKEGLYNYYQINYELLKKIKLFLVHFDIEEHVSEDEFDSFF